MRIDHLTFSYRTRPIFRDFGFQLNEPVAILCGRSGCGKTTLLKLLCRILRPIGHAILDVPAICRLVLQEDALFPWLTAKQNIAVAIRDSSANLNEDLIEPIAHLLERPVHELSYGQRRLVELCRSLMVAPQLLCLDEPFIFLDRNAREHMAKLISSAARTGTTVLLTTHNQEDVCLFDAPVYRFPEETPLRQLTRDHS